MKLITLVFCLFFSYFTIANTPQEEVIFYDHNIENLPPVDEMIGVSVVPDKEQEEAGVRVLGPSIQQGNDEVEVEAEIQLAHGGKCRRHHGGHGCKRHHRRRPVPPVVVYPHPPVVIFPVQPVSNICRNGLFYCHTYYLLPVGSYCQCYNIYGIFMFGMVL